MIITSVTKVYKNVSITGPNVQRISKFVCRKEKVKNAELSFVIVDDGIIRKINKKFLRHDYVTDIITFPLESQNVNAEIYINGQQMRRQAKEFGVTLKNETMRLVIHGVLHAIGYKDTTAASKKKMNVIQERYVAELRSQ